MPPDASNTAIWDALYRSDPAHVKPITGKTYRGSSPKPQWVIKRLTEQFGPVGKGFGWNVLNSVYIDSIPHPDGTEKKHEIRIRFWWRDEDGEHSVESSGGTKALYKAGTKGGAPGYWVDDEDAEKKSLTDAITKAASWLGVAGDIFMGQWDDHKYVAELKAEADGAKHAETTAKNPLRQPDTRREQVFNHSPENTMTVAEARRILATATDLADLKVKWGKLYSKHKQIALQVEDEKEARKEQLTNPQEEDPFGLPPLESGRAA